MNLRDFMVEYVIFFPSSQLLQSVFSGRKLFFFYQKTQIGVTGNIY